MGGPPDAGGAKNALQARASTKSYLERYTLKANLRCGRRLATTATATSRPYPVPLEILAPAREAAMNGLGSTERAHQGLVASRPGLRLEPNKLRPQDKAAKAADGKGVRAGT